MKENQVKQNYAKRMEFSLLLVLVLFILLFILSPAVKPSPFAMRSKAEITEMIPFNDPIVDVAEAEPPQRKLPVRITESENPDDVQDPVDYNSDFPEDEINTDDSEIYVIYESAPAAAYIPDIVYPELAVRLSIEGTVFVELVIEKDGSVSSAVVKKSAHPVLDDAAINTALKMHFTPAMTRDIPIRCRITYPIVFRLKR